MSFGELRNDPIILTLNSPLRESSTRKRNLTTRSDGVRRAPQFATSNGVSLSSGELQDQFVLFQFNDQTDGPRILDTSEVIPKKKGGAERPDALVRLQLLSFRVGKSENVDRNARATLRIDLGKDENSNSPLDTVFWSIAAGLNLYNETKKKPADPKDLKADFNEAFSRRPIEIPGSLGKLSFEVIKHEEPPWWKKLFSFFQSGAGQALSAAVGFPGITQQAIGFVDELFGRLQDNHPKILFKSRPMTLALTESAKDEYIGGTPGVTVGTLNPGFCLLARGRDYGTLINNDPVFMGGVGTLKPAKVSMQQFLSGDYDDPFANMTYAVLRVGSAETKLNPSLNFT